MSSLDDPEHPWLRTPVAEELAIEGCADLPAGAALCTSLGRGQCAASIASRLPAGVVTCQFLDLFAAREAQEVFGARHSNLTIRCEADFPEASFDLAVIPLTRGGESELAREYLQEAFHRLKLGGVLVASVDNPKDSFVHHELEKLGKNLSRRPTRKGVIYVLRKKEPLRRRREFRCHFAFRDGERLVQVVSRPGVFSHRRLDLGARALLEGFTVHAGERLLEIGCGSGAVCLAAALRANGVQVHGVDSNPRAVQCLLEGAALNGIETVTASLSECGEVPQSGAFDIAVGNPPYYSNYKIADIFLKGALKGLRPGGRVVMVTRQPEWFVARMKQLFGQVRSESHRGYEVVSAVRK